MKRAIGFALEEGEKFPIRFVDDIYPLKDKLIAAARRFLSK